MFLTLLLLSLVLGAADSATSAPAEETPDPAADVEAMVGRVHALLALQRWVEALEEAVGFDERLPDDPRILACLGQALVRAGRLDEAESVLERACAAEQPPARSLMMLGRLRDGQGRGREAIELMRRALQAGPDDREVLYRSAEATATRAEAIERLERYLERSEGDDPDRIKAARGSLRLFRNLGERPIWVDRARPERLEIPLTLIWQEQTGRTLGYVLRVRLGAKRKPVALLLDSGSPGLFVIERMAKKCGFVPLAETTAFGGGGGGEQTTTRGFFSEVSIEGLRFGDALATTAKQEIDPFGRFHGLIGLSVFNGYRVTLDLLRKRLLLEPIGDPIDGSTYWTIGGQLLVSAEDGAGRTGLFLLDTGATRTHVAYGFLQAADRERLGGKVDVQAVGGLREGARALRGFEVRFQGRTNEEDLRAVDLSKRSAVGGVEISGFLGLDLLDRTTVELDTVRQTVAVRGESARRRSGKLDAE